MFYKELRLFVDLNIQKCLCIIIKLKEKKKQNKKTLKYTLAMIK